MNIKWRQIINTNYVKWDLDPRQEPKSKVRLGPSGGQEPKSKVRLGPSGARTKEQSETWSLGKNQRAKLTSFEMWCWRTVLRIPSTAKRSNESIMVQTGKKHAGEHEAQTQVGILRTRSSGWGPGEGSGQWFWGGTVEADQGVVRDEDGWMRWWRLPDCPFSTWRKQLET